MGDQHTGSFSAGHAASLSRRALLVLATAAGANAYAQAFPSKPIQVVIPTPPGSGADILARILSEPLKRRLGQPLVVDSKSGASGTIAAGFVAAAPADGYTVLLTYGVQALAPIAYKKLPYRPFADFAPVALVARVPLVVVVPAQLPVKNLREFVDFAKAGKGKVNYASTGKGAQNQLLAESLNLDAGIDLLHIPYKGGGPAIQAVAAGDTQIYFSSYAGVKPLVDAGKLRIIAATAQARLPELPEVQTVREAGYPGLETFDWFGILAPAATPPATVALLHKTIAEALQAPDLRMRLTELGYQIASGTPEDFGALIRDENVRWAARAQQANIKFDD